MVCSRRILGRGDAGREVGRPQERQAIWRRVGTILRCRNGRQEQRLGIGTFPWSGCHYAGTHDLLGVRNMILLRHEAPGRDAGDRYGVRVHRVAAKFLATPNGNARRGRQDRCGKAKFQSCIPHRHLPALHRISEWQPA